MKTDELTSAPVEAEGPFGSNGAEADRDSHGRFTTGNRAAVVHGARSARFWNSASGALAALRRQVLSDLGHDANDAPAALSAAVDGLAQAVMLRDSAFARIAESGGPTTLRGRRRAAFRVWQEAADRVERHARLVGLRRQPKPLPSLQEALDAVAAEQDGDHE